MNAKSVLAIVAAVACLSAAMAAPAVHHSGSIDGSAAVPCESSTMLFGGAVPPNGFMLQGADGTLLVSDNGPANFDEMSGSYTGFVMSGQTIFITPAGYKPMGPVSVFARCGTTTGTFPVAARAW
jgi:hypothetical protein